MGNETSSKGSSIIHSGYLYKQSLHVKKMRKRWMTLSSDNKLISYKSENDALKHTEIIDLSLCKDVKSESYYDRSTSKFPFTLYFEGNNKRSFGTESAKIRDEWIKYIKQGVNTQLSKADALDGFTTISLISK